MSIHPRVILAGEFSAGCTQVPLTVSTFVRRDRKRPPAKHYRAAGRVETNSGPLLRRPPPSSFIEPRRALSKCINPQRGFANTGGERRIPARERLQAVCGKVWQGLARWGGPDWSGERSSGPELPAARFIELHHSAASFGQHERVLSFRTELCPVRQFLDPQGKRPLCTSGASL